MVVEQKHSRSLQDIRQEYNEIFRTVGIRDEDRAYLWQAKLTYQFAPQAKKILDVACGAGYFPEKLTEVYPPTTQICGTDLSDVALQLATKRCPEADFQLSPAEKLPYQEHVFDVITCLGSLEHFLDIPASLKEMSRVMKRDGLMLVMIPNIMWYKDILSVLFTGSRKTRNQTHERFASLGEWAQLFEGCGLKVHRTYKYNGIARSPFKQFLKDILIPKRFSYHFIFILKNSADT